MHLRRVPSSCQGIGGMTALHQLVPLRRSANYIGPVRLSAPQSSRSGRRGCARLVAARHWHGPARPGRARSGTDTRA
jgi:hypothetical protein